MQAPRGKQLKINGNVVNVPANVVDTFNLQPQTLSDTRTIKINLSFAIASTTIAVQTFSNVTECQTK